MNRSIHFLAAVLLASSIQAKANDQQELCDAIGQIAGSAAQARDSGIDVELAQRMFGAIAAKAIADDESDADTRAAYKDLVKASVGTAYEAKTIPPELIKPLVAHSCMQALGANQ